MKKVIALLPEAVMAIGVSGWIIIGIMDAFPPSNAVASAARFAAGTLLGLAVVRIYFLAIAAAGRKIVRILAARFPR